MLALPRRSNINEVNWENLPHTLCASSFHSKHRWTRRFGETSSILPETSSVSDLQNDPIIIAENIFTNSLILEK